jgi:hypothetical protein
LTVVRNAADRVCVGCRGADSDGPRPEVRALTDHPASLYSEVVVELVADPKQAIETADAASDLPPATGLPPGWDQIAPGHLVIAEEGPGYGWWEAIVIERKGDVFKLRYRQFPRLPAFARPRSAIALMSPPAE